MCGICGVFVFDRTQHVEQGIVRAMNDQIIHRGPDDAGYFVDQNVALAMRRLSIIDLHSGHQPICNEDGSVWIVFNGEIYNHRELRGSLEQQGHVYRTNSDTETIVHLYEQYGADCVRHLRGMFGFAIWDKKRRVLFGARDRLGIKPFYYSHDGRRFLFGSEIKALLGFPGMRAELNRAGVPEYLAFGYLAGEETLYEGVRKLAPGHWFELDESGRMQIEQYWDLPSQEAAESAPEQPEKFYVDRYRELLEDAVHSHLMSDVPLGMFLSGGIDSSAVGAIASKLIGGPINTFSVGSKDGFNELPFAQVVAKHIGAIHHEVRLSRDDFFNALPELIWHEDEPIMGPASVALYFVAQLARQHVKVVLTGEGADETLGGYSRHAFTLLNRRGHSIYRKVAPSALRRAVREQVQSASWLNGGVRRKLQHSFIGRDGDAWSSIYFDNFYSAFSEQEQQSLLSPEMRGDHARGGEAYRDSLRYLDARPGDLLKRLLYTDTKTFLVELLMKQDQMSMAASIESRVPFLDHPLVEFAATVPPGYLVKGTTGKWILKKAMECLLPKEIIYRKKMGFPTPFNTWLRGDKLDEVERMLLSPESLNRGLFERAGIMRVFDEHRAGKRSNYDRIWRMMNLELWMRGLEHGAPRAQEPRASVLPASG